MSEYQKDIDSNTKDDSWKAYKTESENLLSKKYDKLFGQEDKK